MNCSKCNEEIKEGMICPNCGYNMEHDSVKMSAGIWILGFLIPILGYIFYEVYRKKNKKVSVSSGYGALFGCVAYFVFAIVGILVYGMLKK